MLCSPHKSGGFLWQFCGTFVCTSKGYVERETSLASLERERVTFQGSLCSPLKSGGFLWQFCCTSKGYEERETSLASLERERVTFQGLLCSPLKSGGFLWRFCVHQKGVYREGNFSRYAQKGGSRFSGLTMLASQKWWFSVALLCALLSGM